MFELKWCCFLMMTLTIRLLLTDFRHIPIDEKYWMIITLYTSIVHCLIVFFYFTGAVFIRVQCYSWVHRGNTDLLQCIITIHKTMYFNAATSTSISENTSNLDVQISLKVQVIKMCNISEITSISQSTSNSNVQVSLTCK